VASNKTQGSAKRLIEVPGYHLHPRFDLVHTRHILDQRFHTKKGFHLNLAPMVDMFSVLVIYLIMNFSATGEVFFVNKDIKIPQIKKGEAMQSFPLVSLVKDKVFFDAEGADGRQDIYVEEINDGNSPQLRAKLKQLKNIEEQIGGASNFKGQVNIQADDKMDADEVKKIMRLLVEEGWTTINFIIEPGTR